MFCVTRENCSYTVIRMTVHLMCGLISNQAILQSTKRAWSSMTPNVLTETMCCLKALTLYQEALLTGAEFIRHVRQSRVRGVFVYSLELSSYSTLGSAMSAVLLYTHWSGVHTAR